MLGRQLTNRRITTSRPWPQDYTSSSVEIHYFTKPFHSCPCYISNFWTSASLLSSVASVLRALGQVRGSRRSPVHKNNWNIRFPKQVKYHSTDAWGFPDIRGHWIVGILSFIIPSTGRLSMPLLRSSWLRNTWSGSWPTWLDSQMVTASLFQVIRPPPINYCHSKILLKRSFQYEY